VEVFVRVEVGETVQVRVGVAVWVLVGLVVGVLVGVRVGVIVKVLVVVEVGRTVAAWQASATQEGGTPVFASKVVVEVYSFTG
jgi:hypothetical protein